MKQLTTKQAAILNYIMDHVEQNGYPPSIRDIRTKYGFSSLRGATVHVDALARKGYLKRAVGSHGQITVLADPNGAHVTLHYSTESGL